MDNIYEDDFILNENEWQILNKLLDNSQKNENKNENKKDEIFQENKQIFQNEKNIKIEQLQESNLQYLSKQVFQNEKNIEIQWQETFQSKLLEKNIIQNENNLCQFCQSMNLVLCQQNGYLICTYCGSTDNNPINKKFSNKNNISIYDNNGTIQGCSSNSNIKIQNGNYTLQRTQLWESVSYKERSLKLVLKNIEDYCIQSKIPKNIQENAKILYKNISECKYIDGKHCGKNIIFRGIIRKSVIAACVFIGSKLSGVPRTPKEISEIFGLKVPDITRGIKKFQDYIRNSQVDYKINPTQPIDFIKRFYDKFNIEKNKFQEIIDIINNIKLLDLASDHQSISIAAACMYLFGMINNIDIQKKQLSDIFKTSEVTITKTFKKIYPFKNILLNNELIKIILEKLNNDESVDFIKEYICNDDIIKNKSKGRPKLPKQNIEDNKEKQDIKDKIKQEKLKLKQENDIIKKEKKQQDKEFKKQNKELNKQEKKLIKQQQIFKQKNKIQTIDFLEQQQKIIEYIDQLQIN